MNAILINTTVFDEDSTKTMQDRGANPLTSTSECTR